MSSPRAFLVAATLTAFAMMGHSAAQGGAFSLVVYRQNFENTTSLRTTGLLRLGLLGGLALEPDPRGGQRLAMHDDAGFALPAPAGDRFSLAFTIDLSERGSGRYLLGNDRDPQHGFSRYLSIGPDGGIELAGLPTDLVVARHARVELWCCLVAPRQMVVEKLVVARPDLPTEQRTSNLVLPMNGLFFFRHIGPGTVHVDDLILTRRP